MDMCDKIKKLRAEQGLTLEQVGKMVGVGKSTVRKWENGQIANMRRDKIAKLATALNTTPAFLMGWEESEPDVLEKNISYEELSKLIAQKDEALSLYKQADQLWQHVFEDLASAVGYDGDVTVLDSKKITRFIKEQLESAPYSEKKQLEHVVSETLDKNVVLINTAEMMDKRSQRLLNQVEKKINPD